MLIPKADCLWIHAPYILTIDVLFVIFNTMNSCDDFLKAEILNDTLITFFVVIIFVRLHLVCI